MQNAVNQYIGETKLQFHERMKNHKSDIRTNKKVMEWSDIFPNAAQKTLNQQYSRKFVPGIPSSVIQESY